MSQPVEPPASESEADPDPEVEQMIEQARTFHTSIDAMKKWSHEVFADVRGRAAVAEMEGDDEEAEQLRNVAQHLLSVADRIESGDANRTRRP